MCRKARQKIVKKNWKKRLFKLFAVGNSYTVLVYYKDERSDKVKGRYYLDSQCQLADIQHAERKYVSHCGCTIPFGAFATLHLEDDFFMQVFEVTHSDGSFAVRLDAETHSNWALWRTVYFVYCCRIARDYKEFVNIF